MKNKYRVEDLPNAYIDYYVAQAEGVSIVRAARTAASVSATTTGSTATPKADASSPTLPLPTGGSPAPSSKSPASRFAGPRGLEANHNGEAVATGPTLLVAAMRTRAIMAYGRELELDE